MLYLFYFLSSLFFKVISNSLSFFCLSVCLFCFICFSPAGVWACTYFKAKQPLTWQTVVSSGCLLSASTNRQQCKSAHPEGVLSSPGWSQVYGGILSLYTSLLRRTGQRAMLSCTLYIMPAEPSRIVFPSCCFVSLWKHAVFKRI